MKKRIGVLGMVLAVVMVASLAGVARADHLPGGNGDGPVRDGIAASRWQIILYFGDEDLENLEWYWDWAISSGIGVGCGFVGLGIGTLNPFAGFFVSAGCESALMA
jgi:hypothetical protein